MCKAQSNKHWLLLFTLLLSAHSKPIWKGENSTMKSLLLLFHSRSSAMGRDGVGGILQRLLLPPTPFQRQRWVLSRDYHRGSTYHVSWGCLNSNPLKDILHPCSQVTRRRTIWPRRLRSRGGGWIPSRNMAD